MTFKAGDKVICKEPISELETDKVYEILECYTSGAVGGHSGGSHEWVKLTAFPEPYFSFRFKLWKNDSDENSLLLNPMDKGFSGRGEYFPPINHVDEGLISITTPVITIKGQTASKNDQSKVDLSLIPRISNIEHAKAFMVGEKKYNRYNYCKGHKASQLVAAAKRHLDAWFENEENDPIDGQHHLGSVMACCSMILRQMELGTMKDDRFKPESSK